jgi:hypothetical protein
MSMVLPEERDLVITMVTPHLGQILSMGRLSGVAIRRLWSGPFNLGQGDESAAPCLLGPRRSLSAGFVARLRQILC